MTYKISKLSILFIFATLVFSCKKTDQTILIEENPIAKKSITEQRQYLSNNFKQLMKELKPIFLDTDLKNILYSEVAKKFDGDDNVLIKTLINNPLIAGKINNENVNTLLQAFYNINGRNYHPQIYIPNFNKHSTRQNLRTTTGEAIEVIFYDGNETVLEVPTYTYNEDGDVVPTGLIADEADAVARPLYVLGLNEGPEEPIIYGTSGVTNTTSTVNAKIQYLTIFHRNESWLAGASEVSIKALSTTWNHNVMGVSTNPQISINTIRTTSSNQGHEILKIARVLCGVEQMVNYSIQENWAVTSFSSDPIVYTYVIFEADAWPAPIKSAASKIPSNPNPSSDKDFFSFCSADEAYGAHDENMPSVNYAIYGKTSGLTNNFQYLFYDGHTIQTADIRYNIKKN